MMPVAGAQYPIGAIPFLIERGLTSETQEIIKSSPDFEKHEEVLKLLVGKTLSALQEGFNGILEGSRVDYLETKR